MKAMAGGADLSEIAKAPEVVTLDGIADGAAAELWQKALGRVLENIEDPNTDHKAKRSITLTFTFVTSDDDRRVGEVGIACATKLAGVKGTKTVVFYGRHEGELIAVEQPRQQDLFPAPGRAPVPMSLASKAGD